MKKEEKQLFLELCRFKNPNFEEIKRLIKEGAATSWVLGQLFYNRMGAIAYGVLKENNLLDYTNREFRNSLKNSYIQNKLKNENYFTCLETINEILKECNGKYALLKGAYLCGLYPSGYRVSNDIDILTETEHISRIAEKLNEAGFKQGYIKNDIFTPATRKEIVSSKMMRGETVPYIKEINLPFMKYLELDINYSLSYKNENDGIVGVFVSNALETETAGINITTLSKYDFMLHLCEHLYKEASTYPWVKMKRDMTLYKFCDIYTLLNEYSENDFERLHKRASKLKMKSVCYYAVYITKQLFSMKNKNLDDFLMKITPESKEILNTVISPEDKKLYQYIDRDVIKRFFSNDRTKMLKEVKNNAKVKNA